MSAKIPRRLKEKLKEKNVNVSSVVRSALEKELDRREKEELKIKLDSVSKSLSGRITPKEVAKAVRATRDER